MELNWHSLRVQFFVYGVLVLGITILVIGVLGLLVLEQNTQDVFRGRVSGRASNIACAVEMLPTIAAVQEYLERLPGGDLLEVDFVSPDGIILASNHASYVGLKLQEAGIHTNIEKADLIEVRESLLYHEATFQNHQWIMTHMPAGCTSDQWNDQASWLHYAEPYDNFQASLDRVRFTMLLVGIFLIIMLVIPMGLYVHGKIVLPLRKTTLAIRELNLDDPSPFVFSEEEIPPTEIGTLMRVYNEMAQRNSQLQIRMSALLSRERGHLEAVIAGLREGVILQTKQGQVLLVNDAAETLMEKLGMNKPVLGASLSPRAQEFLNDIYDGEDINSDLRLVQTLNLDDHFFVQIWIARLEFAKNTTYLTMLRDVSKERRKETTLRHLSETDPLTGLPNRRRFFTTLNYEIDRALRYQEDLSLIIFDLDDLKTINDTYGHQTGDQALELVSKALCLLTRQSDLPARYAGDEFVLLLPQTSRNNDEKLAMRLLDETSRVGQEAGILLSISIGVASLSSEDDPSGKSFLARADQALYQAKKAGKGQISVA